MRSTARRRHASSLLLRGAALGVAWSAWTGDARADDAPVPPAPLPPAPPPPKQAEPPARPSRLVTVNPGLLVTDVFGHAPATGVGGELSFMVFPHDMVIKYDDGMIGIGGFGQAQSYGEGQTRYAVGAQVGNAVGLELGYAYRAPGASSYAGLHSVHAGVFLSLGVVVGSLRASVPLAAVNEDATHPSPGFELGLSVAIKIPIPIVGGIEPGC